MKQLMLNNNKIFMGTNVIKEQLTRAIEMRERVLNFASLLQSRMQYFDEQINTSVRLGFPQDIAEYYRATYYSRANMKIEELVAYMKNGQINYLDQVINDLRAALDVK